MKINFETGLLWYFLHPSYFLLSSLCHLPCDKMPFCVGYFNSWNLILFVCIQIVSSDCSVVSKLLLISHL